MASERARELRKRPTEAEKRLWQQLRELNRRGMHFRRQVPLKGYIVDFCWHSAKLVIEVDGGQHNAPEQRRCDAERTARLEKRGYRVIRFWNNEVLANTDGVLQTILSMLNDPHPIPSPQGGGVL
jgi:very-short-patch-repair endonuclease